MNEDRARDEEDPINEPWITHWEQQCIQEVENEADLEERIRIEKDFATQKSWQMFQNAATAIAQLYKDRPQGLSLWASFQTAAGAVTCMYKESLDIQKKISELGNQCGYQRRTRDLMAWAKKHRRHIRREDLIAYLADKAPPSRSRGSPRQRLTLDRSSPRLNLPSCQEPITSHTHNPEADMQTFREALTLASLNGAMSNVSVGYRSHGPGSPPLSSHSRRRNAFTDVNAFICEEFVCGEGRKRSSSSTDVIMDSPTQKRSRLM